MADMKWSKCNYINTPKKKNSFSNVNENKKTEKITPI